MKQALKTIAVNVGILSFLLCLAVIVVPAFQDIHVYLRHRADAEADQPRYDMRYRLPMYRDYEWSPRLFAEFDQLRSVYRDFMVWQARPFHGQTITVDDSGFRRHGTPSTTSEEARIWMFGGSTMWGDGAPDNMTIPAYLEKIAGLKTFNFGRLGYIAHQELNLLMKQSLEAGRLPLVVFYDGYNEVAVKCRADRTFYSSWAEGDIARIVAEYDVDTPRLVRILGPLRDNLMKLVEGPSPRPPFDCDHDERKAQLIAEALVQDWMTAKAVVERNGGRFLAVLQPSAFIGAPNVSYLPAIRDNKATRAQHDLVYTKMRLELSKAHFDYVDLANIFDGNEMIFIDQAHVIPRGNEIVAAAIAKHIR